MPNVHHYGDRRKAYPDCSPNQASARPRQEVRDDGRDAGLLLRCGGELYRLHVADLDGAVDGIVDDTIIRRWRLEADDGRSPSHVVMEYLEHPFRCTCDQGARGWACAHVGALEQLIADGLLASAGPTWEDILGYDEVALPVIERDERDEPISVGTWGDV